MPAPPRKFRVFTQKAVPKTCSGTGPIVWDRASDLGRLAPSRSKGLSAGSGAAQALSLGWGCFPLSQQSLIGILIGGTIIPIKDC